MVHVHFSIVANHRQIDPGPTPRMADRNRQAGFRHRVRRLHVTRRLPVGSSTQPLQDETPSKRDGKTAGRADPHRPSARARTRSSRQNCVQLKGSGCSNAACSQSTFPSGPLPRSARRLTCIPSVAGRLCVRSAPLLPLASNSLTGGALLVSETANARKFGALTGRRRSGRSWPRHRSHTAADSSRIAGQRPGGSP